MLLRETKGLIAAPFTPFDSHGELNVELVEKYAKYLIKKGLKGVFICGSTGESASLTLNERKILAEKWVEFQQPDFKVFVHVGTNSVVEGSELAAHAEEIGAAAIAATGPSYFKPNSVSALVDFMAQIASSAPKTAFYYYHIPGLNQNYLSVEKFLELALDKIPNLSGLKYTHEDEMEFQLCRQLAHGQLDILYGRDETLICSLALGATGAVGSTYNFMPELYYQIIEAFNAGQIAKANELQVLAMRIIKSYVHYRGIAAGKVIMKHLGLDCGKPRLPICALNSQEEQSLMTALAEFEVIGLP